jgi:histidine triad (HIT) family protein
VIVTNCIFCRIIAGAAPASIVYADDATLAFLDLRQPSAAHVLVVPKRHVELIFDLEPDEAARLMQAVVLTARAIRASLRPDGLSVYQSNGSAAGQEVPHVHFHLLTRSLGDRLLTVYEERPAKPARATLDQLAATIRAGFAR